MSRIHPILLLTALPLVACSSDEDEIKVEGPHYTYVVNEASVPSSNPQAVEFGLDLNGDNIVDNALGNVLATLKGLNFDVQGELTTAINEGDIILLMDLQTPSFSSSGGTGLQVHLSEKASAMPAPCTDAADMTCRKHLAGTGSFMISADSPPNAAVTGKIVGGTFDGGPGSISLKIALGSSMGVQLDLIGARARANGMSEGGIDSVILAGAVSEEDLNTQVIPAIHQQLLPIIARDCPNATLPNCTCTANSTGGTILGQFDKDPKDCMVSVAEIQNHPLIDSLLSPDVTIDGKAALSLGIKVKATKATIR